MTAPPAPAGAPRRLVRPFPGWPAVAAVTLWVLTMTGGTWLLAQGTTAAGATSSAGLGELLLPNAHAVDLVGANRARLPSPREENGASDQESGTASDSTLYLGLIPLVLALAALASLPRIAPAVALVDLALAGGGLAARLVPLPALDPWRIPGAVAALVGLAHLAASGLHDLVTAPARRPAPVAPAMTAAVLALVLAAGLGLAALWSGSVSDAAALRPWLALRPHGDAAGWHDLPERSALAAAAWRAELDRAAMTAFASLVALLWFLKRRDAIATAAVLVVAAADLGCVAMGCLVAA